MVSKWCEIHKNWWNDFVATVLNPRYITRISWRVNFVSRHRSSKATGIGFGVRADGSNSNRTTSSSIGLSGGVAMLTHRKFLLLARFRFSTFLVSLFFFLLLNVLLSLDSLLHSILPQFIDYWLPFSVFSNNARRQALYTLIFTTDCRINQKNKEQKKIYYAQNTYMNTYIIFAYFVLLLSFRFNF